MIKKATNKILTIAERLNWQWQAIPYYLVPTNGDQQFKSLLRVLQTLDKNNWSKEELESLNQIREIRNDYLSTLQNIEITDFGAGKPEKSLTQQDMQLGSKQTLSIPSILNTAATSEKYGKLIFQLIREFKPENCLELGTSLGISGAYQLSSIKLNQYGQFTTIEGAENLAKLAEQTLTKIEYPNFKVVVGRFADVLPQVLSQIDTIDFVFIDGHHDKEATQDYFDLIYPYLKDQAIVIFDDINWSKGMNQVWQNISNEGQGVKFSVDLYHWGICLIDKKARSSTIKSYKINF